MSIELDDVTSGYNVSVINKNFQTIEDKMNDEILWRKNSAVAGEAKMERDLDMDGYNILNADIDGSNITNDRALRVPSSEGYIDPLPPAESRKGNILSFDINTGLPVVIAPASGSAVDVLNQLASSDLTKGDALVAMKQPSTGSKLRTVHDKFKETYSVLDFDGVVGDGVNDDTAGIQAAINAVPFGGTLIFPTPSVYYKVSSEITINKPIVIQGNGGPTVARAQMPCIKATGAHNVFKLIATLDGYRFEYGITGVVIRDIMIEGKDITDKSLQAICVDETVNAGVFHVRENSFENVHIRYFTDGFNIRGICYLNNWIGCRVLWCSRGCVVDKVSGASEGASDQNRFFGCEFVLNDRGLVLSEEGYAGSQTIVGCTMSEGLVGLIVGFNTTLHLAGCQIENNQFSGVNITIPSTISNPASEGAKNIVGNCFILNGNDIVVDKQTTAFAGGFAFPMNISGNTFSQTVNLVLTVSAPTGPQEFDSRQFVFSSTNAFSPAGGGTVGLVPDSRISSGFAGYNGFHEDGKVTISGSVTGDTPKNRMVFSVPAGKQCYIKWRCGSVPDLASAGSSQASAALRFTNASTATLINEVFGKSGEFLIPRSNFAYEVTVAIWANTPTAVATGNVEYCIL